MTNYVVWMDSENAHIFALGQNGVTKSTFEKTGVAHHTTNKKDQKADSDQEHFFRDLAIKLKDAEQLLLMGPGLGKTHFQTHLKTHHTNGLADRIVGSENSEHLTDKQVLAKAREYYKTYDKWEH